MKRPLVSLKEFDQAIEDLQVLAKKIRDTVPPGAFISPHEVVGMCQGQLMKLSIEADDSLYTASTDKARERMLRYAYGLIFGAASMDACDKINLK